MTPLFLQLLIFGLLAALANVLGGLVLFPSNLHERYKRYLKYLLALGAGFMLAVTIPNAASLSLWAAKIKFSSVSNPYFIIEIAINNG